MLVSEALQKYWGFDALRGRQQEALDATISGCDSLVVMPTGGGKSLCYQLPPLMTGGFTLVVSPLIALMKDQVDALQLMGYPAAALHSNLSSAELEDIEEQVRRGAIRLLYTSPERVATERMMKLLQQADAGRGIKRIAIDEAHCISNWGHDFRPEYRQIAKLRKAFPEAIFQALTATATPLVRDDIVKQLELRDPEILVGTFDRPNLTYRIVQKVDPIKQIFEAVPQYPTEACIVYCVSRKDTERYAESLQKLKINAVAYHAGLDATRRSKISEDFAQERINVIVATVAFGMGIDRSDVRCVVHESIPKSIEAYQQETGRAGRDGLPSECLTLYSPGDAAKWRRFINDEIDPARVKFELGLLDEVRKFAAGTQCRHAFLSGYFGQDLEPKPEGCGGCDLCLEGWNPVPNSTKKAHMILAMVNNLALKHGDFGFGATHIAHILTGANREEIRKHSHDQLRGYGALKEFGLNKISDWIGQLADQGFLSRDSKYATIRIEEKGMDVLRNRSEVMMRDVEVAEKRQRGAKVAAFEYDEALFEKLRVWRKTQAEEQSVPAFVIFGDSVLMEIAARKPSSAASLLKVPGIGESKMQKFGTAVLAVISDHLRTTGGPTDVDVIKPDLVTPVRNSGKSTSTRLNLEPRFAKGQSIEAIQQETGLAASTISQYLSEYVRDHPNTDVTPWVSSGVIERVQSVINLSEDGRLKPIYEALNAEVPYDQIRLAMSAIVVREKVSALD